MQNTKKPDNFRDFAMQTEFNLQKNNINLLFHDKYNWYDSQIYSLIKTTELHTKFLFQLSIVEKKVKNKSDT